MVTYLNGAVHPEKRCIPMEPLFEIEFNFKKIITLHFEMLFSNSDNFQSDSWSADNQYRKTVRNNKQVFYRLFYR